MPSRLTFAGHLAKIIGPSLGGVLIGIIGTLAVYWSMP
jgi:hypothetical protein